MMCHLPTQTPLEGRGDGMKKTADEGDDAELEQHRGVAVDSPSTEPQRCAAGRDDPHRDRDQCVSDIPTSAQECTFLSLAWAIDRDVGRGVDSQADRRTQDSG